MDNTITIVTVVYNDKNNIAEHSTASYQPEWLSGAFMATAW